MAEEQTLEVTIKILSFNPIRGHFAFFEEKIGISVQCLLSIRA